jgi:alanine dehydrogenase
MTNATLPETVALANEGWKKAHQDDAPLALGLNTHAGLLSNLLVAEAHSGSSRPVSPRFPASPW